MDITPVENHRGREKGVLVYPVYSRRSKGLSVGINLYPQKKSCTFDCPYCEVFPFANNVIFTLEEMEEDLRSALSSAQEQGIPVKDICFSGNGEPTLSPSFPGALDLARKIQKEMSPSARVVIITNGTGLLQPHVFSVLKEAAACPSVSIWLKTDAGTPDWYKKMNRSSIHYNDLVRGIKDFAACSPVTIQTMLCAVNGESPPAEEAGAWESLLCQLAANKAGGVRKVQIYGKARSSPEDPLAEALPADFLEKRAETLRRIFAEKGTTVPVEVYQ